jgi:hypothetical protein
VFASSDTGVWTHQQRREALTVVTLGISFVEAIFFAENAGGITLAARATLDRLHMMDSFGEFKNYFGLGKYFLLTFVKNCNGHQINTSSAEVVPT